MLVHQRVSDLNSILTSCDKWVVRPVYCSNNNHHHNNHNNHNHNPNPSSNSNRNPSKNPSQPRSFPSRCRRAAILQLKASCSIKRRPQIQRGSWRFRAKIAQPRLRPRQRKAITIEGTYLVPVQFH